MNKFNKIINIHNTIKQKISEVNEINLKLDIRKNDINNDIYFLDNFNGKLNIKGEMKEFKHSFLKELNEKNTHLYFNGINYKYNKCFKPEKEGIYNIRIKLDIKIKHCTCMFGDCINLIEIDLSKFNTKNVTNMTCMFCGCSNLKNINLSSFNTKQVTDMTCMFGACHNLKSIDLSSFVTKKVTRIDGMFQHCINLKSINLSSFDTKKVINMNSLFNGCSNLKSIDLSSFDINNNVKMKDMFDKCNSLKKIIVNKNSYNKIKEQLGREDIEIKII